MGPETPRRAHVEVGVSRAAEPAAAAAEAAAAIPLAETCFVLAFAPSRLDPDALAAALAARLQGVPVFGCTTAGQITERGYEVEALLLLAFPKANFRCASILISPLNPLSLSEVAGAAKRRAESFMRTAHRKRLALLFADGLSKQEDLLIAALETALDDVPVFGGSAGDGLDFGRTFVLHNGRAYSDAALLVLLETDLRFEGIGFDHFLPGETALVVTEADPDQRLVFEINGAPAAAEYARLVGRPVEELSPLVFAENPMLVRRQRAHYVRAISDATPEGALSFLAAIDDGLVMTLGRGREIIETLEFGLAGAEDAPPDFILGFECVLRRLEIEQKRLDARVSDIFRRRRVLGFNTYGEQHRGVHMNQTFVGVAFYGPEAAGPA
ncbi:MAG: FIST N-terminal domain-containing protein [Pseudomonadota bacterium]